MRKDTHPHQTTLTEIAASQNTTSTTDPIRGRGSRQRGSAEAESRYLKLKASFDSPRLDNGVWYEVDTRSLGIAPGRGLCHVDLFAGAGGMSQGFRQAGYSKVLGVEIDADAVATLRRNFPNSAHIHADITQLSNQAIDQVVQGRAIQVVSGGPPCQGFSVAGLRRPDDPRNQLFREYVRIVRHLKPDFIVMENVPGILTMSEGKVYREILDQLAEAGYPGTSVRVLEAAEFGVPQLRTRAIFVGNRHGLRNPYPRPTHAKQEYRTIESAISDLADRPIDPTWNHEGTKHSPSMARRLAAVPPGGSLYDTFRDAWKRQRRGVPSMAIKENHGGVHIHYELDRVLTAREMARLQTFPDDFIFEGTFKRAYWQIGNAVPCTLAEHLAAAVAYGARELFSK